MNEELSKEIAEWNLQQFPKATLESQLLKLEEEIEEMDKAIGMEYMKELVDIFIVASSLYYRFNSYVGKYTLDILNERVKKNTRFVDFVKEKMEINRKRNWSLVNGTYHH